MKIITVPNTIEAMKRMDFDECNSDELSEINLTEDEYTQLWESGILDTFNRKFNLLIDDYENESIVKMDNLLSAKDVILKNNDSEVIKKLLTQVKLAITNNTGVFFYF